MLSNKAIVIGAGIVGLAAARALAEKGYSVTVFEKNEKAVGASVRNFGMVWPIGQPAGKLYERALRTRKIWEEICKEADIWHSTKGSLQLAYHEDELEVIKEFVEQNKVTRNVILLSPDEIVKSSPAVKYEGLLGGFFSPDEMIVDPREAIAKMPSYLAKKYNIEFHFCKPVTAIEYPFVYSGTDRFEAEEIYICSGPDFEGLYPELYYSSPLTKCKLQMMRTAPQPNEFNIGPALCGGLTLLHYGAFSNCPSLEKLNGRVEAEYPEYVANGIHVMMSQNGNNELVIGDTHHYGLTHDPFDRKELNDLILSYLDTFAHFPDKEIAQTWNGTYVKMKKGTELVLSPVDGVTIVNGLGGAGMSLSFGLLEEVIAGKYELAAI